MKMYLKKSYEKEISMELTLADKILELKYQLTEVINFFPDPTFMLNKSGEVIAWNPAMEELTNIKAKEILGKSSYEYSLPFYEERSWVLANLAMTPSKEMEKRFDSLQIEKDTIFAEFFLPHLKSGGKYVWAKAKPIYDLQGNIVGAIETIRDIAY